MAHPIPSSEPLRLGQQMLRSGAHIMQIYTSENERRSALLDFVGEGLTIGERTFCISDQPNDGLAEELLGTQDLSLWEAETRGTYRSETSRAFYLKDGVFDPERICQCWHHRYADARASAFPAMRAIAELPPELERLGGGTPLVLYETKLNAVFQASPPSRVICQYDARAFSGWTIMGVLKAHPLVLVDRTVLANPFFAPPSRLTSH
jgi:hypothetical protein